MNEPIMLGRIERDADGSLRVLAPCVGWWTELPHQGALLGPGSGIGRLYRLNQRFRLVLPEDAAGTKEAMRFLAEEISRNTYVNIMGQYGPAHEVGEIARNGGNKYDEIKRRPSQHEMLDAFGPGDFEI